MTAFLYENAIRNMKKAGINCPTNRNHVHDHNRQRIEKDIILELIVSITFCKWN